MKYPKRDGKLKSALRQNLRKRKSLTRKLGKVTEEVPGEENKPSMKLRSREINITDKGDK